jgi:alpha-D-xyloside xylohydrolase
MQEAHEKGDPAMRTLFYQYPQQPESWQVEDQYLLGADILVAPVLHAGQRERKVWLPAGETWVALNGERYEGGRAITVAAPMSEIPVFVREGADVKGELGI